MATASGGSQDLGGRKVEVKYGEWLSKALDVFKADIGGFIVAGLVVLVVQLVAILGCGIGTFIVAGPMFAGLLYFHRKKLRGEATEVGDLFYGIKNHFVDALIAFAIIALPVGLVSFVAGIIPLLGMLLGPIVGLALGGVAYVTIGLALLQILNGGQDGMGAVKAALNIIKAEPLHLILFGVMLQLITMAGALACCIGLLASIPLASLTFAIAGEDILSQLGLSAAPQAGSESPPEPDETPTTPTVEDSPKDE